MASRLNPTGGADVGRMNTSGAWGLGLMALGGIVGALLVLWLLVSAIGGNLRGGGAVLGLVLIVVLAGPLLGGGYFLWRRSAVEERHELRFEARRRLLEGDRLFRQQAAAGLRSFADRLPESPDARAVADRLRDLAAQVER